MSSSQPLRPLFQTHSPDLTAIAVMLSEAAQALLSFSDTKPSQMEKATDSASVGETRCYHLFPSTLRHEYELLQRYRVEDFPGLLAEAHLLLAGLVKIMKNTHPDARLRGHSVSSLGALLEQISALLLRMRNVYDKVERMPA